MLAKFTLQNILNNNTTDKQPTQSAKHIHSKNNNKGLSEEIIITLINYGNANI